MTILNDNQNVDIAIALKDAAGNPLDVSALDPGSLTVTWTDATEFTTTPSADQSSINVRALGTLTKGDVGTINATYGGGIPVPNAATVSFDVVAGAPATIVATVGTPADNVATGAAAPNADNAPAGGQAPASA